MRCTICKGNVKKAHLYNGDPGTAYEGKPLCDACYYENDAIAVVMYGRDEEPHVISGTRNETDGDFRASWRSIDPWRGYYEVESEKYAMMNKADALTGHESQGMLKSFDDRVRELYDERGVGYARAIVRTSNVFCSQYDLFVVKEHAPLGVVLVGVAKAEVDYDNPRWQRNIIFGEAELREVARLFPERGIQTDHDVVRLVKDYGEGLMDELDKRTKEDRLKLRKEYVV